jgi:hypothetical protein
MDFRSFLLEDGAYRSDQLTASDFSGRVHPQVTLDFPTETKQGEVFRVTVKGGNYSILIHPGITVLISRKLYHKRYDRLPQARQRDQNGNWIPGDMVTAVFYKYKDRHDKNYKLKSFNISQVR